jgi:hypothetical protein
MLGIGFYLDHAAGNWSADHSLEVDHLFRSYDRTRIRYDGTLKTKGVSARPHYWRVDTKQYDYFDYLRLGGSRNIRGYLEEEFTVNRAFWINLEYTRYPVFPLADIAWLTPGTAHLLSYGFGIDARTGIARASLMFAWPKNGRWYDGKVHFMLEKSL